jgi:uncharacterized membrane protein
MKPNQIKGLVMALIGAVMAVFAYITYSNDTNYTWEGYLSGKMYYTYEAPLTSHEWMVIGLAVVGVIILIIGVIMALNKKDNSQD